MSRLGNIGAIEGGRTDKERMVMTRQAIERLDKRLDLIERTTATTIRNNTNITIINNPPTGGITLPETVTLAYPMVITVSSELLPNGWSGAFTIPWKITFAWMQLDPNSPAGADTSFTFKNAPSSPTSAGSLTVLSGATYASGTMSVLFSPSQRLYITAPANLNYLQNIYALTFKAEAQ